MDLVKIGFIVSAKGLKEANAEVDKLLTKADKLNALGSGSGSQGGGSGASPRTKKLKDEANAADKMIQKQQTISQLLPYMDKGVANLASSFWLVSKEAQSFNKFLDILDTQDAIVKQKKQTEALVKEQQKQAEAVKKTVAQYENLSQKSFGGGILDSIEQQNKGIEELRQKYKAEEKEANKKAESIAKAQEKQAKAVQDTVEQYEALSNKSLGGGILDQVEQQNKGLEELKKQYQAEEKEAKKKADAEQKILDDAEQERQKHFSKVQKEYEKQQQAIVDAKQQAIDKQIKAQNTLNESNQKAIALEQAKAKYVKEGFGKTDAGRLARLEVSGADVSTLTKYKDAIDSTRNSMRNLSPVALTATKSNSTLLDSIKGIAAYALLSTAIHRAITALTDLAVSIVSTADEMTNLTQRLGIYLPENIKVNQVLERMGEIAKENRVTLADTGKLFTQLLPPIQRIKGGVAETTAIVDAFGKAMLVGGANTMEAASATIQFGQAMASGKLAGDEFRSLAEASPRLLQAIADGAGIAAQKLKEMSADGKLTSGLVSAALLDQFIQLEYEATKMGQTVSGAFNEGMVAYQLFVNTFNEQTGFTDSIVQSIRDMVKFLEGVGNSFLNILEDSNHSLHSLLSLLKTVWDLVGSLVSGFADVVGWVIKALEETGAWKTIFDTTKLAIITIVDTLAKIPFVIVNIGTRIAELVLKPFEKFIELAQKGLDLAGFDSAAARLGQGLSDYRGFMGDIKGTTGDVITGFNLLSLGVKKTETSTGNVKDIVDKLKQQNKDLVVQEQEKKAMTDSQYISEYAKLLLQQEGVAATTENLNLVKKELQERFKITQEQAKQLKITGEAQAKKDEAEEKAKKAEEKANKAAEQNKKRLQDIRDGYQDQITSAKKLMELLSQGEKLEVARIASQKDYISVYKGNLSVATELATLQESVRKEENRQEYTKSLKEQAEQLSVIAGLTEAGADYETARALAAAGFVNDAKGRAAAEKTIMNTLTGQSYALSDQITDQETLNKYLKEGMGIEEARFKVALSRIAKLSGGKNVFGKFGEDFENGMKLLRVKRATEASQQKINTLDRESKLLTSSMAFSYTAASLAAAKLAASTQGLLYSQAQTQLEKQNEVDLSYEQYETSLKISSLLSKDSEVMRDIKSQYPAILDAEAKRSETARKLLVLAEAYSTKQQEQKKNPFGDFSNINFDVFGDIGNPFKEALDGVNALVYGMTSLDEKIKVVRDSMLQYQVEAELASLSGQTDKAKEMMDLANKQLYLEKDLQKQKAETVDIAYGQGLKFAKSFFKENSKGYKIVSGMEKAYQASKIAFALWEKKDAIAMSLLKLKAHITDALGFTNGAVAKMAAQEALNITIAQGSVASAAQAPPPVGFASAAAMIALLAGIGIAIGGGGGSSGSFEAPNNGTGTVFGDTEAKSASIKNSIESLSDNSDLMLPLTSAMLASLKNIESSIGGVTNLIIRNAVGSKLADGVNQGFSPNLIGKLLSNPTVGVLGGTAMGAMGALALAGPMGMVVGALLGPILGKALGGLFGSKTTIKGQGLFADTQKLGDIITKGFDLFEYVDVQIKKKALGITTSTKNRTQTSAADAVLEKQFTLIFSGFYDSILKASTSLEANMDTVKGNLENAVIRLGKIDLKGLKGDEIQEKLEAVFGAAADSLAQQGFAGLDDFQKVGEGYYETLIRVASSVEKAKYFTDQLHVSAIKYTDILNKQGDVATEIVRQSVLLVEGNKNVKGGFYDLVNTFDGTAEDLSSFIIKLRDLQDQLFMTGKNADYLTSTMILGAGGLDNLSSGLDAYFEMLSPAEQAAELTRRLTREFAVFGKDLPSDVKAFRNLVSGIDISTEAGQKLYGQIIALAPEFNDLQDAIKSANSEVNALVQSLRDLAEQAKGARGETDQTRNLTSIRSEFDRVSALAMQGDIDAANRLVDLGKQLMGVSKTYAISNEEYTKDLALIQRAATVAADLQAKGLGTTTAPTLTTTTGTTSTPTIETTNSAMTTEMQTMREELNAGLFAIAKFVQNLDSRTERWDDGNRVMVGVLAENGDTPLPVTTV